MPDAIQNPNSYWSFHTWTQQLWQYVIKYKNKFEFYEIKYWNNESNFCSFNVNKKINIFDIIND